ncbi:hypothetical protein [Thalassoglobus neptunius]|uniref:hypothetical protein n=1 Tax=Thalassoglobus neptunius TaxID=1938619 RepID=UPI0011B666C0|nr:hypothetical protein [Thalassoglobus neptunius]
MYPVILVLSGCFAPAPYRGPTIYDSESILRSAIDNMETKGGLVFFNPEGPCVSKLVIELEQLTTSDFYNGKASEITERYLNQCSDPPELSQIHLVHGMLLSHSGRHEEARDAYDRSIELSDGSWQPYFHRAFYFDRKRDGEAAEADRKAARSIFPAAPFDDFSASARDGGVI